MKMIFASVITLDEGYNFKVAPVTPVDNTVCSPDSRIFGSVLFFPFPVLCTKMILTQQESTIANDLRQGYLGRRVKERLENALKGASTSKTITAQASYCREVLYVLEKCSQTYSKKTSKTWEVNCAIVHNPHYFARVGKWFLT